MFNKEIKSIKEIFARKDKFNSDLEELNNKTKKDENMKDEINNFKISIRELRIK